MYHLLYFTHCKAKSGELVAGVESGCVSSPVLHTLQDDVRLLSYSSHAMYVHVILITCVVLINKLLA